MKFRYIAKENVERIPKSTGVYSFQGAGGALLYIGKAANLRDRVKNHFQQPSYRDHFFIDQVKRVAYIETNSEIEALLLESALIKQKKPRHNIMWRDGKNYFFVAITKDELPRVYITHQPQESTAVGAKFGSGRGSGGRSENSRALEATDIGPFVDGKALKRTLRALRRVFPYYTAKNHGKKPCQYCHLGLCPGPAPNKKDYRKSIKKLSAVLQGKKPAVLKKLEQEMKLASREQAYEKAGTLRDQLRDLEMIFSHARILEPAEEKRSLDWAATETYLQKILAAKQKISRVEAYDISNIQGKEATGSMPVFVDGVPAKEHYRKFKIKIAGSPNDFAMLEETISRRLRHAEWQYPDLMIIDGGKGQLSAALRALGKSEILVAAIAKRNNELFVPGKSAPLLLRAMPQSVSNFILYMRDEAHRFAISYHRALRRIDLLGKKK